MKLTQIILTLAFCWSASAQTTDVKDLKTKEKTRIEELTAKERQANIERIVSALESSIKIFNETAAASSRATIIDWAYEIVPSNDVYVNYEAMAELSDKSICTLHALHGNPREVGLDWSHTFTESWYNDHYDLMEIECNTRFDVLSKVVQGKDIIDDLNPAPNSGNTIYEIAPKIYKSHQF